MGKLRPFLPKNMRANKLTIQLYSMLSNPNHHCSLSIDTIMCSSNPNHTTTVIYTCAATELRAIGGRRKESRHIMVVMLDAQRKTVVRAHRCANGDFD